MSTGAQPIRSSYSPPRLPPAALTQSLASIRVVKASTLAIAGRSISTLIKTQGIGDLYQMYEFARRNRIEYDLAYIPGDFPDTSKESFDTVYMSRLFDLGFQLGQGGHPWAKTPPRLSH
jgi:hypothetical protein